MKHNLTRVCPTCHGAGRSDGRWYVHRQMTLDPCDDCNGRGIKMARIEDTRDLVLLLASRRECRPITRLRPRDAAEVKRIDALREERKARKAVDNVSSSREVLAERRRQWNDALAREVRLAAYGTLPSASEAWCDRAGTTIHVTVGGPSASTVTKSVWHSKKARRSGTQVDHYIVVAVDWMTTVWPVRLLERAGGMLTLAAEQVRPGLYRATWAAASRGLSVRTERGYIAALTADGKMTEPSPGTSWYHGKSEASITRECRRRATEFEAEQVREAARKVERERQEADDIATGRYLARQLARLNAEEIAAVYPDVKVTLADAIAAGCCPSGSRDWIARRGGDDPAAYAITVRDLAQVADRREFAVRAARRAVLRHEGATC